MGEPRKGLPRVSPRCRDDSPPAPFLEQLSLSDFSAFKDPESLQNIPASSGAAQVSTPGKKATLSPKSHPPAPARTDSEARWNWCLPGSPPSSASLPGAAGSASRETPAACPPPPAPQPPRAASSQGRPPTRLRSRSSTCSPTSAAAGGGSSLPRAACLTARSRPTCPCGHKYS